MGGSLGAPGAAGAELKRCRAATELNNEFDFPVTVQVESCVRDAGVVLSGNSDESVKSVQPEGRASRRSSANAPSRECLTCPV